MEADYIFSPAQCPAENCDGDRAYFFQLQIRSADEPMTTFLKVSGPPYVYAGLASHYLTAVRSAVTVVLGGERTDRRRSQASLDAMGWCGVFWACFTKNGASLITLGLGVAHIQRRLLMRYPLIDRPYVNDSSGPRKGLVGCTTATIATTGSLRLTQLHCCSLLFDQ